MVHLEICERAQEAADGTRERIKVPDLPCKCEGLAFALDAVAGTAVQTGSDNPGPQP